MLKGTLLQDQSALQFSCYYLQAMDSSSIYLLAAMLCM